LLPTFRYSRVNSSNYLTAIEPGNLARLAGDESDADDQDRFGFVRAGCKGGAVMKRFMAASVAAICMLGTGSAIAQGADDAPGDELEVLLNQGADADPEPSVRSGGPLAGQRAPAAAQPELAPEAEQNVEALPVIPLPQETEPVPQQSRPQPRGAIEEIIVTAQRREESAQDVPISITVLKPEQIADANITNSADIATYTPSLSTNTRFGTENASFSIRGFTQELRTTASVGTYFAEVVAPRGQTVQTSGDGAGPGALFDLQNIQVLKGPQGTLFGRNTTGGAVLLVPVKPTDVYEGYAELTKGNYDALRGQIVVNVPVNDQFRLRFGMDSNERDGYMHNVTGIGAKDLADTDYTALRVSGVVDITDALENYTILTYTDSESNGQSSRLFACNDNPLTSPLGLLTGPGCSAQLSRQEETGNNGFYDIVSTIATPLTRIREGRLINTTTWVVNDYLTVKNIFAYAHLFTRNTSATFGTQFTETTAQVLGFGLPLGLVDARREFSAGTSVRNPNNPTTSQATYVEEVQLQGSSFDERLIWQAGAYFENSRPDGPSGPRGLALLNCEFASLEGDPADFNCFDPLAGQVGGIIDHAFRTEYLNQAVYTQGTFSLTDRVSFTGGLRYTWDKTTGRGIRTRHTFLLNVRQAPVVQVLDPEVTSEAPTGLLEVDFKPIDGIMVYAKYVRGYRQGAVNMSADPGIDTWLPEKVDNYELGLKSSFVGAISGRFNIAAFYNDFQDMQLQAGYVSSTAGTTTAIFNAGKARIAGTEIEAFLSLTENLNLSLSYAYLDTELLEQEDRTDDVLAAGGALAALTYTPSAVVGDSLPFASDHSFVASLSYRIPLSDNYGELSLGSTFVYAGEQRTSASTTSPFSILEPRQLFNFNLNWKRILGTSSDLAVFLTNAFDEEYSTYNSGTFNALGLESRQNGQPRMFGARLKYHFGDDE
jgi:iron complex outermembrane recepter protein